MNENIYFEPEIETMSRGDLESLQLSRLKDTIKQAMRSPFYSKLYKEEGIDQSSIESLADLQKLPFTTKSHLRDSYPFGLNAVAQEQIIRLHSSSGTTGNPTVICHTKKDIDVWANRLARCMYMVGMRKSDVFQNSSGYGMFTGGLGMQYAAEWLGALTVPAAAGNSLRQIKFITDFGTTSLHAIPSYAIRLAEVFAEHGINPKKDTKLRTLLIGAEPHTEAQRQRIEELLGVKAYNCFGMSEMSGPGVAFECKEQNGLHIWEDSFICEIIDPETLEPVADGQVGELVLTTLDREAMPLIRYRTRDLTRILPEPCKCGRTHRRIDRLKGRSDDMFIVKGVNIFPMQIEKILMQFSEVGNSYLITIETIGGSDVINVEVELSDNSIIDDYNKLQGVTKSITNALRDEILVTPKLKLVGSGTIPQSEGKAVRVIDKRNL